MTCANCQTPLLPGARFCLQCGHAVEAAAQQLPAEQATPRPPAAPSDMALVDASPGSTAPFDVYATSSQSSYGHFRQAPPLGTQSVLPRAYAISAAAFPAVFGHDATPEAATPYTAFQGFLLKQVSPRIAVSKVFTALAGALVAFVVGLVLTMLVQAAWTSALKLLLASSFVGSSGVSALSSAANSILSPGSLKFFLIEHHVPLGLDASGSVLGLQLSANASLDLPLTGLVLVPALALTLGGYVAASSEYTRRPRFAVARGALIGPIYGLILAICALLSGSSASSSASTSLYGVSVNSSLAANLSAPAFTTFLYGLVWGVLFGALGGWMHVHGRAWAAAVLPALHAFKRRRLAGAFAGAGVATMCAILLPIPILLGAASFAMIHLSATTTSAAQTTGAAGTPTSGMGALLTLLELLLVAVLPLAICVFSVGAGATLTASFDTSGLGASAHSASIGLLQSSGAHLPSWTVLLALIPLVCYFFGGRIAARVAGDERLGDAAISGALMALPLCVVLAVLAGAVNASVDASALSLESISASAGPSVSGVFLVVLVGGAAVGALGGASTISMPGDRQAIRSILLLPLRPVALRFFPLVDRLTGRPTGEPMGQACMWVYDGLLVALTLGIAALVMDVLSVVLADVLPFGLVQALDELVGVLLVSVPLLFFAGAVVASFSTDAPAEPMEEAQRDIVAVEYRGSSENTLPQTVLSPPSAAPAQPPDS